MGLFVCVWWKTRLECCRALMDPMMMMTFFSPIFDLFHHKANKPGRQFKEKNLKIAKIQT